MTLLRAGVTVVTGATSGIGRATVLRLASQGDAVFLVGRDPDRTHAVVEQARAGTGALVHGFVADLASRQSVRALAEQLLDEIVGRGLALDALVHSAGIYASGRVVTVDGVEQTIAVNHIAPFLLTHELLGAMTTAAPARVVVVSSNAHRAARLDLDDLAHPKRYRGLRAYNQSKLANVLFVRELAARGADVGVRAHAVDPGLVDTGIGAKHSGPVSRLVWGARRRRGAPPDHPARTIAALAGGTLGDAASGTYWRDGRPARPSPRALDDDLAAALWRTSCDLCGIPGATWMPAPHAPR